jgi:voltage-gated potassium channel Kch
MKARAANPGLRSLGHVYLRKRYAILFYSLLFTLAGGPLLRTVGSGGGLLRLFLAANLLAAVVPIRSRGERGVLLGALVAAGALQLSTLGADRTALPTAGLAVWMIIGLITAAGALRFALRASAVDSEHVYAALGAYVLVGLFFGVLYWILEATWPASVLIAGESVEGEFSLSSAIYFSFVTLATLGYGDVVPGSEISQGFAIVEAVAGQLYLAVMVARLVSLYVRGPGGGAPLHGPGPFDPGRK